MKKKILVLSLVSLAFLVVLPVLLAVWKSQLSFAILIFWLYLGCPLFSVVMGAIAGRNPKALWYFAVAPGPVALVICLTAIQMSFGFSAFYGGCYLLLGGIAMAVSFLLSVYTRNQDRKIEEQICSGNRGKR